MHRPIGLSAYYLRDKKLLACYILKFDFVCSMLVSGCESRIVCATDYSSEKLGFMDGVIVRVRVSCCRSGL